MPPAVAVPESPLPPHAARAAATAAPAAARRSEGSRRTQKPAQIPAPPSKDDHGRWLRGVTVTEYWPAPESWFRGELVQHAGLPGKHRIDWLYSAMGVSMEGQGLGLDGRMYHIDALGLGGWVTLLGRLDLAV